MPWLLAWGTWAFVVGLAFGLGVGLGFRLASYSRH